MAITKNPLIRYKILDRCFSNPGKRYFIEDLIETCNLTIAEIDPKNKGISRRQILDDISFMESAEGWSIDLERYKDGKRVFYRYVDLSYSINNMPLNELEIHQLETSLDILSQFKGMPQFEWVNELIPKLKQGMESEENSTTIIEFDSNQYLKGIEHLGNLYNAILYKKILNIFYQPFDSDTALNLIIHPYYLKQYNNRWFLFGYNPETKKSNWNLALDRIQSFKEEKGKYIKNTTIDWSEYFSDIVGVTKSEGAKEEVIVLHFYGTLGRYMETKPIHESQKPIKWIDKNTAEINLSLIINYEFERLILSYGENVKVISPKSFQKKIKDRIKKSFSRC